MSAGPADYRPGVRPLRRDAERNRQRILAAAREVFAERGLGATLDDVAHRAGLGVGTVYRRFADKAELVDALFEQRVDDLAVLAEEAADEADSWDGLVGFVRRACELMAADHGLRDVVLGTTFGRLGVSSARERLDPAVQVLVRRAQDDGHLRADLRAVDVPLLHLMIGSVVEYTNHVRPGTWRRYLSLILDGLRARPDATALPEALEQDQLDEAMRTWNSRRS
jgi:AcrR family transcriptional regulator